jgi:hypothetical protein
MTLQGNPNYTADVYVNVDGNISGLYEGSTFPDSKKNQNVTEHNTLNAGKHEIKKELK